MLRPELSTTPDASVTSEPSTEVSVVGGGASGTLLAIHLLASRAHDCRVVVYESSGTLGRGLAYGTTDPRHLLNVRSRHMSAFPDIPSDLVEWAARTGRERDAQAFLPRRDYAAYLADTLRRVSDHRLTARTDTVRDIEPCPGGGFVVHSGSTQMRSAAVVLAHGNAAPAPLKVGDRVLPAEAPYMRDATDLSGLVDLGERATAVVVGSGLTAVDCTITFLDGHPSRRVVMVSRSGRLPFGHIAQNSTAWVSPVPSGPVRADDLAGFVADQITAAAERGVDWRAVVDGLRAPTPDLWRRMSLTERRRFLSVHAREWETRRHRMAPDVWRRIQQYQADGRLQILGGGLSEVTDHGDSCEVTLPRLAETVWADAIINCTGPGADVSASDNPVLAALTQRGLVVPDPLRLGVCCTTEGEVIGRDGTVVPGLYVIGPPRKGVLWETTAVPEIRTQAAALARILPQRMHSSAPAGSLGL